MTMTALRGSWSKDGVPLTAELGGDLPAPSRDLFPHCPLPVQPPAPRPRTHLLMRPGPLGTVLDTDVQP